MTFEPETLQNAGALGKLSEASNHHCCVLAVDDVKGMIGIMITGSSGSGKSSLLLGIIETLERHGQKARFVCDDQAIVFNENGRLLAYAPASIRNMVEVRGFGITHAGIFAQTQNQVFVDLVVRLVPEISMERIPDRQYTDMCGIKVETIFAPQCHEARSVRIVRAWLAERQLIQPELKNDLRKFVKSSS